MTGKFSQTFFRHTFYLESQRFQESLALVGVVCEQRKDAEKAHPIFFSQLSLGKNPKITPRYVVDLV